MKKNAAMTAAKSTCPCGSGRPLAACCGPCLEGTTPAASAEALMRSRYTAYVLQREDYLLATWHAESRPATLDLDASAPDRWLGLTVRQHRQQDENHATVEFIARYKIGGRAHRLHEISRFVRETGRWLYANGTHPAA